MCGIFGYIGSHTNAAEIVFEGIKTLEYRGYDSWGVGLVPIEKNDSLVIKKRVGKIGDANVKDLPKSSLAFGHTRWATHGGVTEKNTHPHPDCTKTIAIIHNGIIENYDTLKTQLIGSHTYISETDSEVAAHMIEDAVSSLPFVEAVRSTFMKCAGSNAIIAISQKERMIVAARNGSPLVVGFGDHEQFIASDASGLLPHTKRVYFLEDNEMAVLTNEKITILDAITGKEKTIEPVTLTWNITAAKRNGFPTFMEKEIHEQPIIIEQCLHRTDIHTLSEAIIKARGSYLIGCGTAYYACLAGTYLFSTIAKRHINACVASEFTYQEDFITNASLVVALSQSGETMDLIDAVKRAKKHDATIASIVNVQGSTLWRLSDIKIPGEAGPEIGVASTKDMITKLSILLLTAYDIAGNPDEGKRVMKNVVSSAKDIFDKKSLATITAVAKRLKTATYMFVVGRGTSYPAALETALKIKEISYIHAEGLAAGELKHGAIALIENKTPCVVFLPNDETYSANLAAAMEMKARGGYIIGISHKHHEVFDAYIPVTDAGTGTIIPNIIVGQLLAYYVTIARNLDPDKPRNLAKSVTVK
ncbi:MAG: glutamine--fructose-6-phosphate transaminase (isomerizing) [Candidatus Gottesmanbacteria bacterium]